MEFSAISMHVRRRPWRGVAQAGRRDLRAAAPVCYSKTLWYLSLG